MNRKTYYCCHVVSSKIISKSINVSVVNNKAKCSHHNNNNAKYEFAPFPCTKKSNSCGLASKSPVSHKTCTHVFVLCISRFVALLRSPFSCPPLKYYSINFLAMHPHAFQFTDFTFMWNWDESFTHSHTNNEHAPQIMNFNAMQHNTNHMLPNHWLGNNLITAE